MTSEAQTPQPMPLNESATSFDDSPVCELLEKDVNSMSHDERVAFVAKLRSLRNAQHLKASIAPRASTARTSKVPAGFDAQTLLDQLLKDL
jgi:hypothetical protein